MAGATTELSGHWPISVTVFRIRPWVTFYAVMGSCPHRSVGQNTTWKDFIASHMAVLAGSDFFSVEVLTWQGLVTYYVLFFIQFESRSVSVAGMTRHPTQAWMEQMARNATQESFGLSLSDSLRPARSGYEILRPFFRSILTSGGVQPLMLPPRSPNLNVFAERWVRSVKEECLSKLILFGERSLRRALSDFTEHYHLERNHQGKGTSTPFCFQRGTDHR